MINLLLPEEKNKIRTMYQSRRALFSLVLLLIAFLIGIIIILPAFFLVIVKEKEEINSLEIAQKLISPEQDDIIITLTESIREKFNFLEEKENIQNISLFFESIIDNTTTGITIIGFLYKKGEEKENIIIQGHSINREVLIDFIDTVKKTPLFDGIDLPFSNLAKSKDISFTLTIFISNGE